MLKFKNYVIAMVVTIIIAVLVHIAYDIATAMNSLDDIEFYMAFIGGGITLLIFNIIRKRIDLK